MTRILNTYIFGSEQSERIIKDWHVLSAVTFEVHVQEKLRPYYGMTINQLLQHFCVETTAKNVAELLLARMLGVAGKISATEEFQKAGIIPKTIRLMPSGLPRESMSFPTFDFIKLSQETWEESDLFKLFSTTRFMFVVFQSEYTDEPSEMIQGYSVVRGGNAFSPRGVTGYKFKGVFFWNMPNKDIEEVHRVWDRTVKAIREGVVLIPTSRGVENNLPKQSESAVAHVRPHGKDGNDKLPLPNGKMMTKQCFWLNNTYIRDQINIHFATNQ